MLHRSCFRYDLIGYTLGPSLVFIRKVLRNFTRTILIIKKHIIKTSKKSFLLVNLNNLHMYISNFLLSLNNIITIEDSTCKNRFSSSIKTNQWVTTKYIQQVWDGIISTNCPHLPHSKAIKRFFMNYPKYFTSFNGLSTNN